MYVKEKSSDDKEREDIQILATRLRLAELKRLYNIPPISDSAKEEIQERLNQLRDEWIEADDELRCHIEYDAEMLKKQLDRRWILIEADKDANFLKNMYEKSMRGKRNPIYGYE